LGERANRVVIPETREAESSGIYSAATQSRSRLYALRAPAGMTLFLLGPAALRRALSRLF